MKAMFLLMTLPGLTLAYTGIRTLNGRRGKTVRIILLGVALGIAGFILMIVHYRADISDISISYSTIISYDMSASSSQGTGSSSTAAGGNSQTSDEVPDSFTWYDSAQEAVQNTQSLKQYVEDKEYKTAKGEADIQWDETKNVLLEVSIDDNTISIVYGIDAQHYAGGTMRRENGRYSQPYDTVLYWTDRKDSMYKYDCDDKIAQTMVDRYILPHIYSRNPETDQKGNMFFYGCWSSQEELESIQINGRPLDQIVPIHDGSTSYFWTYTDSDGYVFDTLSRINYSKYTLGEVMDDLKLVQSVKGGRITSGDSFLTKT